jgi:hypothetical protein
MTSPAEPCHVHDITAARAHALPALYRAAARRMPALADGGYEGAGIGICVPVKNPPGNQEIDLDTKTRNAVLSAKIGEITSLAALPPRNGDQC